MGMSAKPKETKIVKSKMDTEDSLEDSLGSDLNAVFKNTIKPPKPQEDIVIPK